jgi:peptidoglycan hydrolase-like protein with peptidoglycan-binding domain
MKRLMVLAVALCAAAMPMAALAQGGERPTYEKPLSAQAIHDVQARLRALGYYGGPIDGAWGPGTRAAVERFQRDRRLAVSGQLNQATVTAMGLDPDRLVALERFQRERRLSVTGRPSRETLAALGLNPDRYMSGSSSPRSESDRLNRRELEHVERSGQF